MYTSIYEIISEAPFNIHTLLLIITDTLGGTSALNELASGTLEEVYPTMNKDERLHAAVDVAKALADLHSLGHVVHADIAVRQFLKIGGRYKLNDFNTSGMMHRRVQSGDICPFQIHKAGDKVGYKHVSLFYVHFIFPTF